MITTATKNVLWYYGQIVAVTCNEKVTQKPCHKKISFGKVKHLNIKTLSKNDEGIPNNGDEK